MLLLLLLQEADVDLDGLDWIVCHSGADIWHGQQDGQWDADDQWEQLIDFRYPLTSCCCGPSLTCVIFLCSEPYCLALAG